MLLSVGWATEVWAANIGVVASSDAAAYQEALEGFKETTRHRIVGVQTLKDTPAGWRDELKKLRAVIEPDLVFVIGTSALQAVAGEIVNIPVIHAMVFNPFTIANASTKNITGIGMIPSVNQTIALLKELNPKYRRIGVIYDPIRTGALFFQARSVAQKENIQLIAREIRSSGEIAGALKSLEKEIDALWLWPDEAYLGYEILQRFFLFSFDTKIPVLGLSERHTQMGAVLSLSYGSAKDMGRQAGEAANSLLGETRGPYAPTVAPRQTKLTVNLKTARKLSVDLPDSIIQRADNAIKAPVYREGEWWVFRIKMIRSSSSSITEFHKVVFKNGTLNSDDPHFLTGVDKPGLVRFLPFASLYVDDPKRKWLDFPLLVGKKWSFNYHSDRTQRTVRRPLANAEVVGQPEEPIETPAGKFQALEIHRTDYLATREGTSPAYLRYFYSPETKSVIRLKAEIDPSHRVLPGQQFELELISHGINATAKIESR
jgi:putative ABC transport system substrate-binding protein